MRWISCAVCLSVVVVHLVQLGQSMPTSQESLASPLVQDTLQRVNTELEYPTVESSGRHKRTVGVFRRIFPELSKMIDDKIQQITRVIFRVVGRAVLSGGLGGGNAGGGGGGGSSEDSTRRISIVLPTYPPDEEEEETEAPAATEEGPAAEGAAGLDAGPAPEADDANAVGDAKKRSPQGLGIKEDNEGAESSQEEFSDDIDISESEENSRSKRLGVFGNLFGGASGGASAGGGSGNFLFDIIRRTADGAARAAGTVYRLVAGTDDFGLRGYSDELSAPSAALEAAAQTPVTASVPPPPTAAPSEAPANTTLVAGSGQTEQQDENANSPLVPTDQVQAQPIDDGYQTGIPGPITRLFVIANRGIANLVQDLILRLAQTSERIVNFKARLITAII